MNGKIGPSHLERGACVYVRQSTAAQVLHHQESTQRQYALAQHATALGWQPEAIEVIDEDQGRSGASVEGRTGFERLVDRVAHGELGAIFALEVSRLARSSPDWQRLLSLCAVADVVVADEQGVYDPGDKDDKLLLDIKGTMSEAELHWLGLRLTGARQSKARRAALRIPVPTGYVWTERGLALDPDEAVQRAVRSVFEHYAVEPSAWAVVRWARETGLTFPTRRWYADGTTEVAWRPLGLSRLHEMLRNPTYAGVYAYGRRPTRKVLVDGEVRTVRLAGRDPDAWGVRIPDAHPGYIRWETFVKNQEKLRDNLSRRATRGAPREGAALLAGLLVCGRCGRRMHCVYYGHGRGGWGYLCAGDRDKGQKTCWSTPGPVLDHAVEGMFLATMTPSELDLSLAVERQVGTEAASLARQWKLRIEQCTYETRCAERRYKAVDPDNRVVARTLERDWETRLRELEEVQRQYDEAKRRRHVELSDEDRSRIRALAHDLPAVWRAPSTRPAERKAMLRLVVDAVSLSPIEVPRRTTLVHVAWKSGAVTELEVTRPSRRQKSRTPVDSVERLKVLAASGLRDEQIAEQLNRESVRTGTGGAWSEAGVKWVRRRERIARVAPDAQRTSPLPMRFPDGSYSVVGVAKRFDVSLQVARGWLTRGLIAGRRRPYARYRSVWWITLDARTVARIEAAIASGSPATAPPRPAIRSRS